MSGWMKRVSSTGAVSSKSDPTAQEKKPPNLMDEDNLDELMNELGAPVVPTRSRTGSLSEGEEAETLMSEEESEFSGAEVDVLPRVGNPRSNGARATANSTRPKSTPPIKASPSTPGSFTAGLSGYKLGNLFRSPSKGPLPKATTETEQQLIKRIKILEEEQQLGDTFKRSLKETLGLQLETTQTELEMEREKVKKLQQELKDLKLSYELGGGSKPGASLLDLPSPVVADESKKWGLLLTKLRNQLSSEKTKMEERSKVKTQNYQRFQQLEDNKIKMLNQIKEETLFLQQLREERNMLDVSAQPDKANEIATKIGKSEFMIKKFNDDMEHVKKSLKDLGDESKVDEILEKTVLFHEQIIEITQQIVQEGGHNDEAADSLRKQLEVVQKSRDEEKSFREKLEATLKRQSKELEEWGVRFSELESQREGLTKEKNVIAAKVSLEEQQIASLTSERDSVARSLEDEKKLREQEKTQFESQIHEFKQKISSLEAEKVQLEGHIQSFKSQISSFQDEKTRSEEQIQSLKQNVVILEEEKSGLEVQIQSFKEQVTNTQAKVDELKVELEKQRKELEAARLEERTRLEEKLKQLQDKLQEKDRELQITIEKLEGELKTTQVKVESLHKELQEASANLESAKENWEKDKLESKEQLTLTQEKLETETTQTSHLKLRLSDLEVELKGTREELESEKKKAHQLEKRLEEQIKVAQTLEDRKKKLEGIFSSVREMMNGIDSEAS